MFRGFERRSKKIQRWNLMDLEGKKGRGKECRGREESYGIERRLMVREDSNDMERRVMVPGKRPGIDDKDE